MYDLYEHFFNMFVAQYMCKSISSSKSCHWIFGVFFSKLPKGFGRLK